MAIPRGRHENLKSRLKQADLRIHGSISNRLQDDRDNLDEENAHKDRMDAIGGFRKSEIIPIGKLQRAIDESDTESEPLSESEETASGRALQRHHEMGHSIGVDPEIIRSQQQQEELERSIDWQEEGDVHRQDHDTGLHEEEEDLDADLEDLDGDYSRPITDPDDLSGSVQFDSFGTDQ
ncbi:hypothetical protein PSTT_04322 [Puccinia striiformis]|uniref:Uncharacterized protein n=1 Tax=Puccinia striiformis TaxID=27350 RepID=A0A2S4VTE5_9BASI|nr:hypothetical protein PSTT_04322 [Puccinia striiformis]